MAVNWRTLGRALVVVLLMQGVAHALPVTLQDAYQVGPDNCGSTACDVIGLQADFDINRIVFTSLSAGNITAQIYTNYHHGDASLSPWSEFGIPLQVGDLIFQDGATRYAVPIHGHNGFTAGQLYAVSDFYTAREALGNPSGVIYRPDQLVQVQVGTAVGSPGTVSTACATGTLSGTHCPSTNEVIVTLMFAPSAAFWNTLSSSGMSVHFAGATCGNDVLDGHLTAVPEAGTLMLLGSGLVALGLTWCRTSRRKTPAVAWSDPARR